MKDFETRNRYTQIVSFRMLANTAFEMTPNRFESERRKSHGVRNIVGDVM